MKEVCINVFQILYHAFWNLFSGYLIFETSGLLIQDNPISENLPSDETGYENPSPKDSECQER